MGRKIRLAFYSEAIRPPFDEGIKRTAFEIGRTLAEKMDATVISRVEYRDDTLSVTGIPANRTLLNKALHVFLKDLKPDVLLYLPESCGTVWSFLRARVLSFLSGFRPVMMILLQPRSYRPWKRLVIRYCLRPRCVLAVSRAVMDNLMEVGVRASFVPLGVDTSRFKPLTDPDRKQQLRQKYGIPVAKKIVLHVGHINDGRNIEVLKRFQSAQVQVVVVGSTSTPTRQGVDHALKERLESEDVLIINHVLEQPQEMFQLADVYVFPVSSKTGSIGIPLTVLEAAACGIPVVCTDPQGGLGEFLTYSPGFKDHIAIVKDDEELVARTSAVLAERFRQPPMTEELRRTLSWTSIGELLTERAAQLDARGCGE